MTLYGSCAHNRRATLPAVRTVASRMRSTKTLGVGLGPTTRRITVQPAL